MSISVINILPPLVADMIAAGEVVERPASAVKELMENSIDAGARNLTVEIRSGGAEYLRVTDDGCGMAAEDAGVCFLRHATSKLRDERGLEAIGTLGFRGEALAAIGSVSHVELTTREKGALSGTHMLFDGGNITDMSECGCPEGTTIIVRGLFYNTPARLKFLKSDRAEGAACTAAALRCALGRPEVSVRCIRDGREEFFTAGDGRRESVVYALLGRETAAAMLPVMVEDGGIRAEGFVSSPSAGRGSRAQQYFFCNGRHIRSQLLQAAVEQAYRNTLLTGRFPACVVYLTVSAGSVDVNVHPAKTEVKFSDEKRVFDAVYYAALGALEEKREPARAAQSPEPVTASPPRFVTHSPEETGWGFRSPSTGYNAAPKSPAWRASQTSIPLAPVWDTAPAQKSVSVKAAAPEAGKTAAPEASITSAPEPEPAPPRVVGEALGLYIIAEQADTLIIIDKHAAHERIIFDRLAASGTATSAQALLEPLPVNAGAEDAERISENLGMLGELGFDLEPYGEEAFILRSVPADIDAADALPALEDALGALASGLRTDPAAARSEALKTVACKAAIKAGRRSEPEEIKRLAEAVCSGEVRFCPHGRPVSRTLTRQELDKMFKRIV